MRLAQSISRPALGPIVQKLNPADTDSELAAPAILPVRSDQQNIEELCHVRGWLQPVLPGRDGGGSSRHALDARPLARAGKRIETLQRAAARRAAHVTGAALQ